MAHTSPDAAYAVSAPKAAAPRREWGLTVGAVAVGLGMGLAITNKTLPGLAICVAGCVLLGGTWMLGRKRQTQVMESAGNTRLEAVDPETGLPCPPQLMELLRREMARSRRYGDRTALAVFDVRVTGDAAAEGELPSPATHIAASLVESAREADIVARLDLTCFVVMLTESDDVGAAQFAERTRTKLGTTPFAQREDGHGIYVRAWAGWARWEPGYETPERYLEAAMAELERTRPGYEAQQSWFRGRE